MVLPCWISTELSLVVQSGPVFSDITRVLHQTPSLCPGVEIKLFPPENDYAQMIKNDSQLTSNHAQIKFIVLLLNVGYSTAISMIKWTLMGKYSNPLPICPAEILSSPVHHDEHSQPEVLPNCQNGYIPSTALLPDCVPDDVCGRKMLLIWF